MTTRLAATIAVLTLIAAACGGGASTKTKPPAKGAAATATSAPAATAASPAVDPAADQRRAESLVLTSADLQGWSTSAHQSDPNEAATAAEVSSCLGIANTLSDRDADAHSTDFAMGAVQVTDEVALFRKQSDVDTDRAALSGPKVKACLTDEARKNLPAALGAGATIQNLQLTITTGLAPGRPDQAASVATTVTVVDSGVTVAVYDTQVLLVGPRLEETVNFTAEGQPFPADQLDQIATTAATRLAASS